MQTNTQQNNSVINTQQTDSVINTAKDEKLDWFAKEVEKEMTIKEALKEIWFDELQKLEEKFSKVEDFWELATEITSPIDNIVENASKMIENDPIMDVSKELDWINSKVRDVYKEIIDDDWKMMKVIKSIPIIWSVANFLDNEKDNLKFKVQSARGKIEIIFSWFDTAYSSLRKSLEMQKEFLKWLEDNIGKVVAYKIYLKQKLKEFEEKYANSSDEKYKFFIENVKYFISNLEVLIWNLELTRKRLLIKLDAATKVELAMQWSKPIFKTLLSTALLEQAWQQALDASIKVINTFSSTIDQMSSELTDRAIESSKKAEELASKPILDPKVFIENVKKIKDHFDNIEKYRQQIKSEAEAERKAFNQATETLKHIKEVKVKDIEEFKNSIWLNE